MPLEEVARDLYARVPAEFVAARDERAADAKRAGDSELAGAISALRKPTLTAWSVNVLARQAPEEVAALLSLGDALRRAQRELSGEQLRTLTTQRQRAVSALARRAGELAADQGKRLSENAVREVIQTLNAALADPAIGERVRTGTLATAATYSGFGPAGPDLFAVDGGAAEQRPGRRGGGGPRPTETDEESGARERPASRKAPGGAGPGERRPGRKAPGKKRSGENEPPEEARGKQAGKKPGVTKSAPRAQTRARRELDRAREELDGLLEALDSDRSAVESARAEVDRTDQTLLHCEAEIERLRAELAHAEQQRRFARTAQRSAHDELDSAQRRAERAERRVQRARDRLRELADASAPD